jgi:hypothetical protein
MQPTDHGLKRELKLRDLVLMQILVVPHIKKSEQIGHRSGSRIELTDSNNTTGTRIWGIEKAL